MKLVAKTSDVSLIEYPDMSWCWFIKHVELVIAAGPNVSGTIGDRIYYEKAEDELEENENSDANPYRGNGYFINAKEAGIMAYLAENLLFLEAGREESFLKLSLEKQEKLTNDYSSGSRDIRLPANPDFLEDVKKFIPFARESNGFYIL